MKLYDYISEVLYFWMTTKNMANNRAKNMAKNRAKNMAKNMAKNTTKNIYATKNIYTTKNMTINLITLILMVCFPIRKQTDSSWTNDFKDTIAGDGNAKKNVFSDSNWANG